ncbi:Toxin ParE4 [Asticcacaulis sp. MM231]|uniref:type II toxin-antitoxin system RelE/ParE family toxin n=1 Tax=Asticcacaulis sp. MM231 TaxID=3157666 RepID=UPI0032D5AEB1
MPYSLTPEATHDVVDVYVQGVMMFGQAQAETYHARLEATFAMLGDNPGMAREYAEIDPPVRAHPYGSHIIIYKTDGEDIIILAVRHSRENWQEDL